DSARRSDAFPGYKWCSKCYPQLRSSTVERICVTPGPNHVFEVSRFFYESQGRSTPRKCAKHRAGPVAVPRGVVAARVASFAQGRRPEQKVSVKPGDRRKST